jgi:hypothetical protein
MTLPELGRRKQSSFAHAPLNFAQLHPDYRLPRKWTKRIPKDLKIKEPLLRFLIKVPNGLEPDTLIRAIQLAFGAEEKTPTQKKRIVDDLRIKPIATIRRAKAIWRVLELPVLLGSFLADTHFDLKQLQNLAKQLTKIDYIESAEADIPYPNLVFPQQERIPGCTVGRANAPQDNFWSQRLINLLDDSDHRIISEDGQDIILGLIDTGYTDHFELDINAAYDLSRSISVIDSSNGLDPMTSGTSHGTATGSLITSAHVRGDSGDQVAGIAPGVTVVSIRALDFVIVLPVGETDPVLGELVDTFFPSNILAAMQECMDAGCHVISMSFGGAISQAVREIIREAYRDDIIMCAAAGNCVQIVVEPAALPEVIACAAVGLDPIRGPRPWPGSSHGPQVDISAPGENVYIADWDHGSQIVQPGEGTSFAAPHLAAAAAVWLQKHGIDNLKSRYTGNSLLADVFRTLVRESATVPQGWDTNQYGAGILNLRNLLDHPLPEKAEPIGETVDKSPCDVAMGLIDLLLSGNRLPILGESANVRVDIARVEVRDDGEFWGGAEPYLIETFYRIDGRRTKAELVVDASTFESNGILNFTFSLMRRYQNKSIVKIRQRGNHGNLPEVNIGALEYNSSGPVTINVANSIGRWDTTIRPIPLRVLINMGSMIVGKDVVGVPGFIGALTMLMEEDLWSSDIVNSVKEALRTHTSRVMEETLRELRFSVSLSNLRLDLPQIDAERLALDVEDRARQSVYENASWWDSIGAGLDGDEILIQDFSMVNVLQLGSPVSIAPPEANGSHGRWLLRGSIAIR